MSKQIRINILIFSILTVLGFVYWNLFDFLRWDMFDSPSFVGAARQMFGLEGGFNIQSRLSKPLVLIIPGAFEYLTGLHAQYGFLMQTILAYFGCGFLIYRIVFKLFRDQKLALYGMLLYVLCQPFAIFSLMILVDAVGWFIGLLIIDQSIKYGKESTYKLLPWLILSFVSAIGLLAKESVIFSFIFLGFYQFLILKDWRKRLVHVAVSGLVFALTFILTQWLTQQLFNDSVVGRLFSQQERVGFVYYDTGNVAQIFRIIDYYWLLVLVGLFSLQYILKEYLIKKELMALGLAVIVSLLLMPMYPFVVDRILFMVAPGLIVFALLSFHRFDRFALPMILVGGFLNILSAWLIYMYDIQGLLKWGLIFYGSLLLIAFSLNKRQIL